MAMYTPVLLIAWRRSHTLRQLIDAIRPVAPTRLFVACDGPNPDRPGEAAKVAATREVIEKEIDWPCQIERLYSESNQGCRNEPISAISWFFSQVDEGIILEDDCIPDVAFFGYCEWALNSYRTNKRVMHINGNNFMAPSFLFDDEVSFVSLAQVWGWATWSDRWHLFEGNPFYLRRNVRPVRWSISTAAKLSKLRQLDALRKGLDAWDHQWQITVLNSGGLSLCPRENLISNVGVGLDATHTLKDNSRTFLQTGDFRRPIGLPIAKNNNRLTSFFEKKMGLSFNLRLIVWIFTITLLRTRKFSRNIITLLFFGSCTPVVIASTGRSGSTMLTNSIATSLVESKYSLLPSFLKSLITSLSKTYFDRLEDATWLNITPVIKTHDLFRSDLNFKYKYIFVFGDPLESALSAKRQGELHGSVWLDEHIFHLCGKGSTEKVLVNDVLNYEGQLCSWAKSSAFFVHYSEIWERRDELSEYLGFKLILPSQRARTIKKLPACLPVSKSLFDRLRIVQSRFRVLISGD